MCNYDTNEVSTATHLQFFGNLFPGFDKYFLQVPRNTFIGRYIMSWMSIFHDTVISIVFDQVKWLFTLGHPSNMIGVAFKLGWRVSRKGRLALSHSCELNRY